MKIAAAIFSIILQASYATIYEAQYGGCINATLHSEDPGRGSSFHCHFTSDSCKEGEDWLTPTQVSLEGLTCTCDDDLNQNVFTTGCYNMFGDNTVQCASSPADCPEGWYVLGDRYNANNAVLENCTDGSAAYDTGTESCGKQCLCNYAYKIRDYYVEVGSSGYGKCYNPDTNLQYCAATEGTCADGETYNGPHSDTFSGPECNCDKANTGACMIGDALAFCAVAEDSCDGTTQTFVKAADLPAGVDCRLCKNTWDSPTVSPAPTAAVTPPPTGNPTSAPTPVPKYVCTDDHKFRHQGKKKKSCKWIDMKKKRTDKLCVKTNVADACKIVCGKCCADDLTRTFNVEGAAQDCSWLWSETRKTDQCSRPAVNGVCPEKCGRCCSNDSEFEYNIGSDDEPKLKNCKWFKKAKRAKKWCKQSEVSDACQKSCDSCPDYTVPNTDSAVTPTKSPTKSPVKGTSSVADDD